MFLVSRNVKTPTYSVPFCCFKSLTVLEASSLYSVLHYCYTSAHVTAIQVHMLLLYKCTCYCYTSAHVTAIQAHMLLLYKCTCYCYTSAHVTAIQVHMLLLCKCTCYCYTSAHVTAIPVHMLLLYTCTCYCYTSAHVTAIQVHMLLLYKCTCYCYTSAHVTSHFGLKLCHSSFIHVCQLGHRLSIQANIRIGPQITSRQPPSTDFPNSVLINPSIMPRCLI